MTSPDSIPSLSSVSSSLPVSIAMFSISWLNGSLGDSSSAARTSAISTSPSAVTIGGLSTKPPPTPDSLSLLCSSSSGACCRAFLRDGSAMVATGILFLPRVCLLGCCRATSTSAVSVSEEDGSESLGPGGTESLSVCGTTLLLWLNTSDDSPISVSVVSTPPCMLS